MESETDKSLGHNGHQANTTFNHRPAEAVDLGWHNGTDHLDEPLIADLPNEELWKLIRRFNKQTSHVKAISHVDLSEYRLDLEISSEETFTPIKFKTHLERLYMGIIVGGFHLWKHVTRLRSWRESQRTSVFFVVYTVAWALDCLLLTLLLFLMVLILVPSARSFCFPPAPPAMVDSSTGGVKKPIAGVMASLDSLTGAPEKHPGEAAEQEAHSFVNSVITLAVGMAGDRDPQDIANAKYKTGGNLRSVEQDKTKKPVSDEVIGGAPTAMRIIATLCDTYERFGNALSPTMPFPQHRPRIVLASCVLLFLVLSQALTSHMVLKSIGFLTGLLLFSDPLWRRTVDLLDWKYPDWKSRFEPRKTLFRGVPTDKQLALTLLRIGEKYHAPLPPPPGDPEPPQMKSQPVDTAELAGTLGISAPEVDRAIAPDSLKKAEAEGARGKDISPTQNRILRFVKSAVRRTVNFGLGADHFVSRLHIRHGGVSEKAKYRVGVMKKPDASKPRGHEGPVKFGARFEGKRGEAYVLTAATTPMVGWGRVRDEDDADGGDVGGHVLGKWAVKISDITEVQKTGGLGWKTKIAVAWATEDGITDGILIKTATGDEFHLTAIAPRDELFNRLIAIGTQVWEEW